MTAITHAATKRTWISVFLVELFGVGFALTSAAVLLASGKMEVLILGGAGIFFMAGFALLAPPVYQRLKEKESLFKMMTLMPVWMALAVLAIEAILHLTIFNSPIQYVPGKYMGSQPVAGSVLIWGKEGYGITHYGADGEIGAPAGNGAARSAAKGDVIVLGDSFTEAMQVMDNERYTAVANQALQKAGLSLAVHNFGGSGGCLADYTYFVENIQEIIPQLKPEYLVIQVSTNDLNDNPFTDTRINYFTIDQDGTFSVRQNASIVNEVDSKIDQIARLSSIAKLIKMRLEPGDAPRTNQDVAFERQLETLRKATAGKKVILLPLPDEPSINNGSLDFEDEDYQQLLLALKAVPEWNVIDPLPEFKKLALNGHLPRGFANTLPGEGHMNVWGHAVVGQLLAQKIIALEKEQ